MRNLEGESILSLGDPHVLATKPSLMDGARNAAMNGLREVYVTCGLKEEEADVIVSNMPTDSQAVEALIATAKTEITAAEELRARLKIADRLGSMGEVVGVPLGEPNPTLYKNAPHDEKSPDRLRKLVR